MLQARRFITALVVLLAVYGLYAVTVAPYFEPPPIARKALAAADQVFTPRTATNKFADLFEPGSWELENPKIVENADCTLLIQDYKPLDDGRMELKPCTLIFYTQGDQATTDPAGAPTDAQGRRPIVLRCPQGAILQFDRPLDLGKAQFGRLMGGRLSGEVTIFSPPSKPSANDALRMTTRNVQIDTERAFTPQEVEFQYGSSYGRGRDMTIYLLPREGIIGKQGTPIGGVRALQLAHVEHLHIETDGPGLLPTDDPSGVQALSVDASKPKRPTSPLEIRCKGPLVYDFEQQIAALDDQVEVSRINPDAAPDRLLCSRLMLYMAAPKSAAPADDKLATPAPESAAAAPPNTAAGSPKAALSKLHRLVAVGSPVVLEAPSSSAFVVASRIEYSPLTRRLALESGEGAKQVVLEHNQDKFEARTLEYELAEEGGRLGRLWAAGPGTLKMTQLRDGQSQTIAAQWLKELRIRPHEQNQVLSLVEGAAVEVNSMGSFAANELHVWVLEAPAGDARAASVPGAKPGKASIVPDRLLAVGEVRVDSPQLLARAQRLEAWFVDRPIVDGAEPLPGAPRPPAPGQQPVGPPAAGPSAVTPLPAESPPQQQVSIVGELVQMQIARDGEKTALEDLTIQGGLRIEETRTAKPGDTPLVIVGDDLQLHDGASGNAKLEVRGRPAEVSARGLTMSGPSIHLHKGENRLWIDGPGKASLPVPDKERKSLQPPPAEAERMNVFWRRSMNFDGLTATLLGEVQASTKTQRALSESLEVTLAQPVNFAKPDAKANTEVARLKFDGGVNLENTTLDELGNQTSLELLQAPNMLLDRRTGELRAVGAGWLTSIRKGSPNGLTTPAAPAAAPVAAAAGSGALTHLHVEFEGGIAGDINKHEVSFQRQVRTIYAAVDDWDTRITMKDIDRQGIPALGDKGALLSSERLTVREMLAGRAGAGGQKWVELEAVGNTQVEGQSFTARAERISYTTDKEQLVLQGDGRNDAELWHQQAKGGQYSYTAATKILYWRQTNDVQFEGGKVLDLQQLSNSKPLPSSRKR